MSRPLRKGKKETTGGAPPERIYLSPPHMSGKELDYVHRAFETNWIAPLGENVERFEQELAAHAGVAAAAVLTTGTAAIHLGLKLLGVGPGDRVICPSFTFAASVNPVRYLGAEPVLVDSEPRTWNLDPELLEKAITGLIARKLRPKAIVAVHLYGMPAEMKEILEISERHGIPVLEDAAEAVGSTLDGRPCGGFGRVGVYSFNGNKIITSSGGGCLLSDDEALIEKARFLATQARDPAPHYQHSELGYNYRMSNVVAGIGRGQLAVIDERVRARRENHRTYMEALGGEWLPGAFPSPGNPFGEGEGSGLRFLREPKNVRSNRWLTTLLVDPQRSGTSSEEIRQALERHNIEARPLWKPMHLQPLYKGAEVHLNGVSETLFRYGLCLPSGSALGDADRRRVTETVFGRLT